MDKATAKRRVKVESAAVREILLAWDPLGESPKDEYDCLVDHIVSALHRGQTDAKDITRIIASELTGHFGINQPETEITRVASEIAAYWKNNSVGV